MRKSLLGLTLFAFAVGGSTACATKGFVKTQVAQVSSKVDSLSQSLEETQEQTKQNAAKINDVDQKAQAAQGSADQAQQSANAADSKAVAAGSAAQQAADKANEVDQNQRKLIYEVVLSDDEGNFKFDKAELPDSAKAKIDQMVAELKANPKNIYFEIEGYTDNVGPKDYNQKLGLERAQAVARYLYTQHNIPLHRINVISFGEDNPVAPNKTRDGRAKNRRVVIKVLA
jgi:outer membrane protein OmpA-like peptidoglycan-associated protein